MGRRRLLVVTTPTVALLLLSSAVWAAPPPPPPPTERGETTTIAPPPPSSGGGDRLEGGAADPLVIDQRTPETDLTGVWSYNRSGAQQPNYVREADDDPFYTVNPIGYYQGVSVGGGNLPPFAPKEVGGDSAVLTWTGFQRKQASSQVFFQLSASVEPDITVESGRVFIKLPRTAVKIRNNRRSLITKYFKTPINEVKVSRAGKDVLVVLELRWEATPSWRFEVGQNGYQVLIVEFPDAPNQDGGAPPAPPHPAPPAKAADQTGDDAPFLPSN